jgi:beta-1,4-mannosyltransferase
MERPNACYAGDRSTDHQFLEANDHLRNKHDGRAPQSEHHVPPDGRMAALTVNYPGMCQPSSEVGRPVGARKSLAAPVIPARLPPMRAVAAPRTRPCGGALADAIPARGGRVNRPHYGQNHWPANTRDIPYEPLPMAIGARRSAKLHGRLNNWKPQLWPLVVPFLLLLVSVGWFTEPHAGVLGWPLTILWAWPIASTIVGTRGIIRTRRTLKRSYQERCDGAPVICRETLLVVVPTIGRDDVYPALERSVISYITHLPRRFPGMRVDIITEEGCEAQSRISLLAGRSPLIRVVTVPKRYQTANGTRFKARANHFAHEVRIHEREARDDVWILHMDDDTGVGPDTAAEMAQFIEEQHGAGANAKHMAQGILTYPREYAAKRLTWLADSMRPADDIARFAALTGTGTPLAGVHGELLLVRASVEATIGWDFGPKAIVEDAQFALIFCKLYKGRSAWFGGRCYGASPASVREFIKQRERWSWGLVALAFNRSMPLRSRAFIAYSLVSWVLGPLQHVAVVLAVGVLLADANTSPESVLIVPIWALNMAYVGWAYWEGLRLNAGVSARGRRKWWEPIAVISLIPLFTMLEGIGGLRGFIKFVRRTENRFIVIAKPI